MSLPRHTIRLAAGVTALILSVTMANSASGVQQSMSSAPPTARITVTNTGSDASGHQISVRATRVTRNAPVTVNWGNGLIGRIATTCTDKQARTKPAKCSGTLTMAYTTPRTYVIRVKQRGVTLASPTFTIAAAPPTTPIDPPAPDPTDPPAPPVDPQPIPTTAPPAAPPIDAAWEQDMLTRLNNLRASVGANPVTLCAPLTRAAQAFTADMANRNYFNHFSPEGSSPGDRINAQGYIGGWGENIAAGYADVASVFQGWVDSPGHYTNMVNPDYEHVGFGYAANNSSEFGQYWTQDFGSGGTC